MTQLGEWLAELRDKKGLTQEELAQAMGLDSGRRTISRWEKGTSEPGAANLLLLFSALGVHVSPLLSARPRALNAEIAENNKLLRRLERKLDRVLAAQGERDRYFEELEQIRRKRDIELQRAEAQMKREEAARRKTA